MPFDTSNFDFTKVTPVYDKDNPPERMSEAIRMAVADVEAQELLGIKYEWSDCQVCTAGAVCRRTGLDPEAWDNLAMSGPWFDVLNALSEVSYHYTARPVLDAYEKWPEGFSGKPSFEVEISNPDEDLKSFCEEMLALADRLEAEGS